MIRIVLALIAILLLTSVTVFVIGNSTTLTLDSFQNSGPLREPTLIEGLRLAEDWKVASDDERTASDFDEEEYLLGQVERVGKPLVRSVIPGFKNPLTGEIETMALKAQLVERLPLFSAVESTTDVEELNQMLGPSYGYVEEWDEGEGAKGSTRNWGACSVENDSLRVIYFSATVSRKKDETWKIVTRTVREGIFRPAVN